MSAIRNDVEDEAQPLAAILSTQPGKSLTRRLVETQESCVRTEDKKLKYIRELECLHEGQGDGANDGEVLLVRTKMNGLSKDGGKLVAVSYTWKPDEQEEDVASGKYRLRASNQAHAAMIVSPVRDSVLDRTCRFVGHVGADAFWIDQHCIKQEPGPEKEVAMQAMDLVYYHIPHSVALLARQLQSDEVGLLCEILTADMGKTGRPELPQGWGLDKAREAVNLLGRITNDRWWTRVWTFQENYRAGPSMMLLIPCVQSPSRTSFPPGVSYICGAESRFGHLPGDLCIRSRLFHQKATRLCLAFQEERPLEQHLCNRVITRAPWYVDLLGGSSGMPGRVPLRPPMWPAILQSIRSRNLMEPWDMLPVFANSCWYSTRLDTSKLRTREASVDVGLMALALLNGEIMDIHPDNDVGAVVARTLTFPQYMHQQAYRRTLPPPGIGALTFSQCCRFSDVKLRDDGIETTGNLWGVYDHVHALQYRPWARSIKENPPKNSPFTREQYNSLCRLGRILGKRGEKYLSRKLFALAKTRQQSSCEELFAEHWMTVMGRYIADAMKKKKCLYLARLASNGKYGAIFVGEEEQRAAMPSHVFTSLRQEKLGEEDTDRNDLDRYVSMEVEVVGGGFGVPPKLYTGDGILGLCFYRFKPREKVLFPWPRGMLDL